MLLSSTSTTSSALTSTKEWIAYENQDWSPKVIKQINKEESSSRPELAQKRATECLPPSLPLFLKQKTNRPKLWWVRFFGKMTIIGHLADYWWVPANDGGRGSKNNIQPFFDTFWFGSLPYCRFAIFGIRDKINLIPNGKKYPRRRCFVFQNSSSPSFHRHRFPLLLLLLGVRITIAWLVQ